MGKCSECAHCIWDGEYWDTGHKAYDNWYCDMEYEFSEAEYEKLEQFYSDDNYPKIEVECDKFLLEFWKSEFAQEVNGSDESYKNAMKKWHEKYVNKVAI